MATKEVILIVRIDPELKARAAERAEQLQRDLSKHVRYLLMVDLGMAPEPVTVPGPDSVQKATA